MLGNYIKSLILASKTQGWDPTYIEGFPSLSDTDPLPGPGGQFQNNLPKSAPRPDAVDYDQRVIGPNETAFSVPEFRDAKDKPTRNSNPYPGFDGGY